MYVIPDAMRSPSDFTAWIPAEQDGASVVELAEPIDCPDAEVTALAELTPSARIGCYGRRPLNFAARSWLAGHWVPYGTEPEWLGTTIEASRSLSLFAPGGGEFPRPPDPRIPWIDARVHPDTSVPPAGVTLLVEGQFDHPDARDCRRTRDRSGPPPQPPTAGLPDEDAESSTVWCRGQFVVTSWEILLGPEGRPPAAGEVQLHRTSFGGEACGGVGMSILRFRMDIGQPDPIWLEPVEDGPRSIPVFGPGFRAVIDPTLAVVGPRGEVIARDGTILDPDAPLGPYAVCPQGETVTITGLAYSG